MTLRAVPDRRRQPSDGLVVEASIVARLLRIRLLKLEATVVIVPADVTSPGAVQHDSQRRPQLPLPVRPLALPPQRPAAADGALREAVQRLDEAAAIRAKARRIDGVR